MANILKKLAKSPLAFGGASLSGAGGGYGFGDMRDDMAESMVRNAIDKGINIFDTAPIYGFGLSEERLGKILKGRREDAVIISKSGIDWHKDKRVNMTNDPIIAEKMLHESLLRLQTDYIDIYMIHWPDKNIDIRKPLEVLAKAKADKKILHIGLCNTNIEDLKKAKEIVEVEVVQSELSLFNRKVVKDLFPYLKENGIDFMSWGSLDKGVLSGTVSKDRKFDRYDARSYADWWKKSNWKERVDIVEEIKPLVNAEGLSLLELAIGHNLSYDINQVILCGMKNMEQLDSTLKAIDHRPSKEFLDSIISKIDNELQS
jgi:myo-inositol catabolism protein IolS